MYQETIAFDFARDTQAIATVSTERYDDSSAVTSKVASDLLDARTKQAIDAASAAYSAMLLAMDSRRMRLQSTQQDLATCYSASEIRASLGLALASGLPYSLLRASYHAGRKQLGSSVLPKDKSAMMRELRASRKLQSLESR